MKINIVGKNISVTQGLQEKITKKLSALNKYIIIDDEDVANVLIRTYPTKQKIEVTIPTKYAILRAEVMDMDVYNAIDKVVDKLEDQIRRQKTRLERKHKESLAEFLMNEEMDQEELNSLEFDDAKEQDRRSFGRYYLNIMAEKQIILSPIFYHSIFQPFSLRLIMFIIIK